MEENNIVLTIITPVYNTPLPFFKEYLQSIKDAKIEYPYEVIIVNDGSKNNDLLEFLNPISEENIKIFHKENGGASAARNLGLKNAKGEFILCLDADDILLPAINEYINFLKNNPKYSVAYGDWQNFGDSNFRFNAGEFSIFRHIYIEIQPHTTSLFRKNILETVSGFNEKFQVSEDWDFWAQVATNGFEFKYLKKPLFLWRRLKNGESLSQQKGNIERRNAILEIGKKQYNPHKEITIKTVNDYIVKNFNKNKKQIIKLIIILYFPSIFRFLKKKNIYKNDIIID